MDIQTQINKEANIRYHKITGQINVNELIKILSEFFKSSEYDPDMNALWDMQSADLSAVKPDDVRNLVEVVKMYWGKTGTGKSALVVQSDFEYGLTRMYEILMTLSKESDVMVFKNYDEAVKWLT